MIARRLRNGLVGGALMVTVLCASARPAHATGAEVIAVAGTIYTFFKQVYGYYQTLRGLLGDAGPSIGQQLQAMQDALIAEMRSQRNMALQSSTRSVFNKFTNLSDNRIGDATNADLWTQIYGQQTDTADLMYDIIASSDFESAYQLAPAYNALITTGTGVLKIKGELWPSDKSSWNDFYIWLQPAMLADYRMIGSQRHQCYPGYNPGYSPPPTSPAAAVLAWQLRTKPGKYRDSQLWTKKLENRSIHVETWSITCRTGRAGGVITSNWQQTCNPASRTCTSIGTGCWLNSQTWNACGTGVAPLDCADQKAKAHFDADTTVKIIREAMKGIQTLSGGNDYDFATNDGLLAQGKYVDPWVNEASCGSSGPWAYPQQP